MKTQFISRRSFWFCFIIALGLFLFGAESLAKNPFQIDRAILSSYLVIPFLILLAHVFERNTNWVSYLISCIELTCLKFAATYLIATAFWIYVGDPPPLPAIKYPPPKAKFSVPPSIIPKDSAGTIEGEVLGPDGQPIASALVFIRKGLEDFVFATPTATVTLSHDGLSFVPELTILQTNQGLHAHSQDDRLHTFLNSYPVLPRNQRKNSKQKEQPIVRIIQAIGLQALRCGVHPQEQAGNTSYIAVFHHPFAALSDAQGRFKFKGVPIGKLELEAWTTKTGSASVEILLSAQAVTKTRIQLPTKD